MVTLKMQLNVILKLVATLCENGRRSSLTTKQNQNVPCWTYASHMKRCPQQRQYIYIKSSKFEVCNLARSPNCIFLQTIIKLRNEYFFPTINLIINFAANHVQLPITPKHVALAQGNLQVAHTFWKTWFNSHSFSLHFFYVSSRFGY